MPAVLTDLHEPIRATAPALSYDELPEGSVLRREFDGRGGVIITAPAGEPPAAVLRAAVRTAVVPAALAATACLLVVGLLVFDAARSNRLDPALRGAAVVTLAVLTGGLFLFVWLTRYSMMAYALADARRCSTMLHADSKRLTMEMVAPNRSESLELPADRILSVRPAAIRVDARWTASVAVPCLVVAVRDGGGPHHLLQGHHPAELHWVASALTAAMGISTAPTGQIIGPPLRAAG